MIKNNFTSKIIKKATTKEGVGTIGGAAFGGWIGSSVGIVALGGGIAGTLPIAIVGGVIGYLGVNAFKNFKNKNEEENLETEKKNQEDAEL